MVSNANLHHRYQNSIKKLEDDDGNTVIGIHLQGDLIQFLKDYLIKQGIDKSSIYIRGV